MIGVQSCKHFGCQRSHPMILGFGHPSGAMEDGARGKILVFRQWKWTEYYINYVESVYSRVQIQFSTQNPIYKGSQKGFFRLPSQKVAGKMNFFTIDPMLEKSQVKSGPQKSPNLTVCQVSHPNFDTGIQFST